ncbi:MAG: cellulase family glycosylhydrolase [Terracidiphilus sp.]|jgi:endoglucanase
MHFAFTRSDKQTRASRRVVHSVFVLAALLPALFASNAWCQGTGYWQTSGNKILDSNGNEVRIAGINWYGFETTDFIIHGLWAQDYHTILNDIKSLGYNVIRMPFSNELVESNPVPTNFAASASAGFVNTDIDGLTGLQVMDKVIQNAGNIGLRVILDNHRSEAGNSNEANGLWYTSAYPQANWIADWQTMVNRYSSFKDPQGNPIVIGVDLRNEPHLVIGGESTGSCWTGDTATSGSYTGCPVTNTAQNWPVAAQAAGNAILAINPKLLVFVEGIDCYSGSCDWQGGNLAGVATNPLVLSVPNQLVYSAHDYGPNLFEQPWFNSSTTDASLDAIWNKYWGYINAAGTAPVWVGEFGTDNSSTDIQSTAAGSEGQWFEGLAAYIRANPTINWTYWALNGEDDYALLDANYDPTPLSATKQSMLAAMQFPLTGGGGLACPVPTAVPQNFTGTAASSSQINLTWTAVPPSAPGCTITYDIFSSTTQAFTPSSSNLIASGVTGTTFSATGLKSSTQYYFAAETVDVTGQTQPSSILSVETLVGSTSGFTLAPSSAVLSLVQGASATDAITVTDTGGFTGSVTLAASGLPTGVNATFGTNPTTGTSVVTFTASSTAVAGTFPVTITGTSGTVTASTTITFTIGGCDAASFTVAPLAVAVSVVQGTSSTDTVTVGDSCGFTGSVTFAVSGLPSGVTATFGTNPSSGTTVITFAASTAAVAKASVVTITGTSGTLTASTTINLTVLPTTGSFTLAASGPTLSVNVSGSATDTITVNDVSPFAGSVSLAATGLPSGVTATFGTNPTTGTSVVTFAASSSAVAGTFTVTITGTAGAVSATTTIALTVLPGNPVPACTIGYTISSQWPGGFGAAITITNTGTTALNGWTLTWAFANGQTITQLWNGAETQSGANVTVTNLSYNGTIAAGGSYTGMGFNGAWNSVTNAIPTAFSLNGTACTVN